MPNGTENDINSIALFAGTALIGGLIAFFIFLWIAKMPTKVWYFLPLTTFARGLHRRRPRELARALAALAVRCCDSRARFVCRGRANLSRIGRQTWI